MSMNVSSPDHDDAQLNTTINTTPLVDVMLVMLIIFLITVPVIRKVVPVELPNARNIATQTKPENIVLSVDKEGNAYFNNELITDNNEMIHRLEEKAVLKPQPEVHIRGDKDARFQDIGRLVYDCQRSGIQKVGFLTEPQNNVQ
ncbi:MAG TPA: biopolymer transporter ExbD [Rhizomicrobium sp.]|jgi:biopolymer transport protein ExbD|nr:biopolymer transporter ExbD [Rhizomicrobium sp.]